MTSSFQVRRDLSRSVYKLQELQHQVPVVGDKALVDLVNGIQINDDIIGYRRSRGFLGQLVDMVSGCDRQRQDLFDQNVVAGQQALHDWIVEISDSLEISQIALEATQSSLLEARAAIRHQAGLIHKIETLSNHISTKLDTLESRIRTLELRVAANEDFDRVLTAWSAKQTYTNFSWLIQVALLIREIFSSSVSRYEFETGDRVRFRQLLVNKILAESPQMPELFFSLAELLNQSSTEVTGDTQRLAASLLEIRSMPSYRLHNSPYLFALGSTLELATLPPDTRPEKPAECAIELCRLQVDAISYTTDTQDILTHLVEETADDCLAIMARRKTL